MSDTIKSHLPSLVDLSRRQCIRFSHLIWDVGDAPYDLVEPILQKMTASQLSHVEANCPQILANSDELWKALVARDFSHMVMPRGNYRRAYAKYNKEHQTQLEDASIRLKQTMEKLKQEKASHTITALEEDPLSLRRNRSRRAGNNLYPRAIGMKAGSAIMRRALQSARSKGPIFSKKNTQFMSNSTKADRPNGVPVESAKSRSYGSSVDLFKARPIDEEIQGLFTEQRGTIDSRAKSCDLKRHHTFMDEQGSPKKREQRDKGPNVFLPKKKQR